MGCAHWPTICGGCGGSDVCYCAGRRAQSEARALKSKTQKELKMANELAACKLATALYQIDPDNQAFKSDVVGKFLELHNKKDWDRVKATLKNYIDDELSVKQTKALSQVVSIDRAKEILKLNKNLQANGFGVPLIKILGFDPDLI